jgi:hypothetical protein
VSSFSAPQPFCALFWFTSVSTSSVWLGGGVAVVVVGRGFVVVGAGGLVVVVGFGLVVVVVAGVAVGLR